MTLVAYAFALWLGLYLLSRNPADPLLRAAGAGLILLAVALAAQTLQPFAVGATAGALAWVARPLLVAPAFLWLVAVIDLRSRDGQLQPLVARAALVLTLFLALLVGLVLWPLSPIPQAWLVLLLAVDWLLFGFVAAYYDAQSSGEALWPDFLRSLDYAFFTALFFGAQVALVMWLATGLTLPMLSLLLLTVGSAIFLATWGPALASLADRVALAHFPQLRRERSALRAESEARTRLEGAKAPAHLSQEEFARLTRRAYSQMGNLPRLASNPLTRLDMVTRRLAERGAADTALERAAELRQLLIEGAVRLKPREQGEFGTTDEWRHYNALYFPYVAGLKPYSRRATQDGLHGAEAEAMEWFRSQVPQRTLYNWQTAAAKLVARDLRQRAGLESRE